MKVIIAGGRNFNDYEKVYKECGSTLREQTYIEIVSGTARGADKLGERFAKENNYSLSSFPADWNKYGKSAGYKRNAQMADYADALIAFWDGKSKGTKHMIDLAKSANLKLKIIYF